MKSVQEINYRLDLIKKHIEEINDPEDMTMLFCLEMQKKLLEWVLK